MPSPHEPKQPDCFRIINSEQVRADTLNEEERSVRLTLASETPVRVYDYRMGGVVDEVLLMSGLEIPRQVPMLDSHMRWSTDSVIGSLRQLAKTKTELEATAHFSSNEPGRRAWALVREGHLTDFSIGFEALEVTRLYAGQEEVIDGRRFTGPIRVVTKSRAREGSAVPIGADPTAKVREEKVSLALRAYLHPESLEREKSEMELRELLVSRGMPKDTKDAAWLLRHLDELDKKLDSDDADERKEARRAIAEIKAAKSAAPQITDLPDLAKWKERSKQIIRLCEQHNIPSTQREAWIDDDNLSVDQIARKILDEIHQPGRPTGASVEVKDDEFSKFYRAASDAFIGRMTAVTGTNVVTLKDKANGTHTLETGERVSTGRMDRDALVRAERLERTIFKPEPGADQFRFAGFYTLAKEFCRHAGMQVDGLPRHEVIERAAKLGAVQVRASDGPVYHTTGSFSNLMLDATNKLLLMAYDEANVTYPLWVRTAPSAPDFKTLNRIRFGELPDPQVIPEGGDYPEATTTDGKESYFVEKYGHIFSLTMEAMINDDLNAFARIPAMNGAAVRRKINKTVYAILTGNPVMADGVPVFHASSHGANLDAAALAVTALNTGYTVMMTQAGLTSGTVLNIMPRFLIVPAALSATALQIINSTADPVAGGSAAGNANTANIYGPGGPRRLIPVVEGQLDASTTQAWWLAADTSQIDTIELCFLEGEESPVVKEEEQFTSDGYKYKIRQTWGVKAIDYRGLYQGQALS